MPGSMFSLYQRLLKLYPRPAEKAREAVFLLLLAIAYMACPLLLLLLARSPSRWRKEQRSWYSSSKATSLAILISMTAMREERRYALGIDKVCESEQELVHMYTVAQFAKQVGVSVKTWQRGDREGRLKAR
jgi:hypothetical protein